MWQWAPDSPPPPLSLPKGEIETNLQRQTAVCDGWQNTSDCSMLEYYTIGLNNGSPKSPHIPAWGQVPPVLWFAVPPPAASSAVSRTPLLKALQCLSLAFKTRCLFSPRSVGCACGFEGSDLSTQGALVAVKPLLTAQV